MRGEQNTAGLGGGYREEEAHLRSLWNFMLRNRWLTFGVPVLVVAATVFFVQFVAPVYDAATVIRIDEEKSNLPILDALRTLSSGSEINTEVEVLRSRSLAEEVMDSLALQLVLERPRRVARSEVFAELRVERDAPEGKYRFRRLEGGRWAVSGPKGAALGEYGAGEAIMLPGAVVRIAPGAAAHGELRVAILPYRKALRGFRSLIAVSRPNREAGVVVTRYESRDSVLVHQVPNLLTRRFIIGREVARKSEARSTISFLGEQLVLLEAQIKASEVALRKFREGEEVVALEAEARAQITRLAEFQVERDLLDAERRALAELLAQVRAAAAPVGAEPSAYRGLMGSPSLLKNFAVSELFRSLGDADRLRAELLTRRTLEDPDVLAATARIREIEDQLGQLTETYVQGLANQVTSLDATLSGFKTELARIPAREIQLAGLMREATVLEEIYTLLQTRLHETQIVAAVDDPSIRVVDQAVTPEKPIKPQKLLSLILAVVLGVVLGAGTAFAREHFDDTLHTREELQQLGGVIPVLGMIPRIQEAAQSSLAGALAKASSKAGTAGGAGAGLGAAGAGAMLPGRLVAGRDPRSPVAEAYRSLRTSIAFARPGATPRSLVFTSPTPGDGKSTSAANFAITLAQQGTRCLLVDADMRRGLLNEAFGVTREPGLSNLLLGRTTPEAAIRKVALGESGSIDFLPTGTLPPNPAELLGSERMHALLAQLQATYEVVILDAPPLNLVTDAALLGVNADGVILVARSGVTERGAVAYAVEQLAAVRAPVLGTVLNDIDMRKDRYYGSYSASAHMAYYGQG
jgi:tyrosine-protein kinase Etk/Wzc